MDPRAPKIQAPVGGARCSVAWKEEAGSNQRAAARRQAASSGRLQESAMVLLLHVFIIIGRNEKALMIPCNPD